jgi:hypothetical protein
MGEEVLGGVLGGLVETLASRKLRACGRCYGGAFHEPSSARGFDQDKPKARKNGPLGAGLQFASLFFPGESC